MNTAIENSYKTLKPKERIVICPPKIKSMVTGVWVAEQIKNGTITLIYIDGSRESRKVRNAPEIQSFENFFAIVSWVQEGRNEDGN